MWLFSAVDLSAGGSRLKCYDCICGSWGLWPCSEGRPAQHSSDLPVEVASGSSPTARGLSGWGCVGLTWSARSISVSALSWHSFIFFVDFQSFSFVLFYFYRLSLRWPLAHQLIWSLLDSCYWLCTFHITREFSPQLYLLFGVVVGVGFKLQWLLLDFSPQPPLLPYLADTEKCSTLHELCLFKPLFGFQVLTSTRCSSPLPPPPHRFWTCCSFWFGSSGMAIEDTFVCIWICDKLFRTSAWHL